MNKLIVFLILLTSFGLKSFSQEMPQAISEAINSDDPAALGSYVGGSNVDACYFIGGWQYSVLSQAIRKGAKKCFDFVIEQKADVNKACEGYVPPIMHAAKYGRLDMIKILVEKGAVIKFTYSGAYTPAKGETPLSYAEKYNQTEVANYLRSLN